MNPVDSDLEEGEILDDSPSSSPSNNKHRELPLRYVQEKFSPVHKHKKDCKYANNFHVKNVAKKPKFKNCHKRRHKSSCSREKSHRPFDRHSTNIEKNLSKKDHSIPNYTLISEIKGSLRDHSVRKQSTKYVSKPKEKISEAEKIKNDSSKSELSGENVGIQMESSSPLADSEHSNQLTINNTEVIVLSSDSDTISNTTTQASVLCINTSDNSSKEKDEESEDEEELRRIALATCIKRTVIDSSENSVKTADCNSVSISGSSSIYLQTSSREISSPSSDNYDVVDMEVDEDIEASIEILDNSGKDQLSEFTENLFVIDTKPSEDMSEGVQENSLPEAPIVRNSSDEDFETDILRAELIESLYSKKGLSDECVEEKKSNAKMQQKQVNTLPEKKHIGKYKKLNTNFYHKQLRPGRHVVRKTVINKAENLQANSSKPSSPILVNKPSERLVIALNDESSSEDSADSESENPVASIEALISDCRQKSDSNEKAQKVVTNVPKAVSCLSKAQQEEYTSLMKILAQKEKLQGPSDTLQHKNGSVHVQVHLDKLKLLQKQLRVFKEAVKKKKELMLYLSKEINSKKLLYMKSKLTAQQLRQQYLAADKIRKANLCAWSKSCSDLKNAKKTVSGLESKIILLQKQFQIQYSKVSASMPGRTVNMSSLPAGNR